MLGLLPRPEQEWCPLSPREQEVLRLLACGYTTRRLAEMLCVSQRTIEAHMAHIRVKRGLSDAMQVRAYAVYLELYQRRGPHERPL